MPLMPHFTHTCTIRTFFYCNQEPYVVWCWQCLWGDTTSLNCCDQRDYCSPSRLYMNMKNHEEVISTAEIPWLVHQSSLDIPSAQSSNSKARRAGEWKDKFYLTTYLFHTSKGSLTCRKNLQQEVDRFISSPMEGVLRIVFIGLKKSIALARVWNLEPWFQCQAR
jgi:hypothetical protein